MTHAADGGGLCAQGALLSVHAAARLRLAVGSSAEPNVDLSPSNATAGRWFCPRCGLPLTSEGGGLVCGACRLDLTPLVYELIEFNPHEPAPLAPDSVRLWLELHDSKLQSVDDDCIFIAGYVHRWVLRDGVWSGTGWRQRFQLEFGDLRGAPAPLSLPVTFTSGLLEVACSTYENMIPFPLAEVGSAQLRLDAVEHRLHLVGELVSFRPVNDARLVEHLPQDFAPVQ